MDKCSRHATPPAVLPPHRLAGHDLELELEALASECSPPGWLGTSLAQRYGEVVDPH